MFDPSPHPPSSLQPGRDLPHWVRLAAACALSSLFALPAAAQPPCHPCAGVTVERPDALVSALRAAPPLQAEARLYVRWIRDAGAPAGTHGEDVAEAGATPWVGLRFTTPASLLGHLEALDAEIAAAAAAARSEEGVDHYQILWEPSSGTADLESYSFLFKRASVALRGAKAEARVLPQPLPTDPEVLRSYHALGDAAYLDGFAIRTVGGPSRIGPAASLLRELEPGRPVVLEGQPFPAAASSTLVEAARWASQGIAVVLFDLPSPAASDLGPLVVLANEFQGDVSFDAASTPDGPGLEAWSFVRGEDLSTRTVVSSPSPPDPLELWFSDPSLRRPESIDLATGERRTLFDLTREPTRLGLRLPDRPPVALLSLERPTAAELQGVEEQVDVAGDKVIPVEEILRRLQEFEDAQDRRLRHYEAVHTNHLRFQSSGTESVEVTYEGDYFYRRGGGFDWAWQRLYINGVRWKRDRLPEIPIIQPEKAAAAPLEIHFTPEFRYRLRGTEVVDGRDTWVVDFEPRDDTAGEDRKLHRGTVWVDREHYGRVRMRTLQLGLEGDVLSNDETISFRPVDANGVETAWSRSAYWLPLRSEGQQVFSVLNSPIVVEREATFREVRINGPDYDARRDEVLASESTMVRDTEQGLRYLVPSEDGETRVVQEEFDTSKLFLLGGVFYDDAADYPLPLAGIDYLNLDFRGTGAQANVLFAGVFLAADLSDPSFLGSRFDAGVDAFALGISLTDETFRGDEEAPEEDVEYRPANLELKLGRPLGSFAHVGLEYSVTRLDYSRADDTGEDFVIPTDHLIHSVELEARYSRRGYRLTLAGSINSRDEWEPWGTPEQVAAFDPDTDQFQRWEARLAKTWHRPKFRKLGAEVGYFGGENLDRFTKYEFGSFSATRVRGYQSSRVRAEEAIIGHLTYGWNVGEVFRLEGLADVAWATDEATGLDRELLGGVGVAGGFLGPWGTLLRVDAGVAVEGPDDGFSIQLFFLKLFR